VPSIETNSSLFAEERRRDILALLGASGKVTVEELASHYAVSLPTIRTDLSRLEEQGMLRRTHGGAIPLSPTLFEPPYAQREVMHQAEKRAIAREAAALVNDGETILLDAGTTVYELALALKIKRNVTIVTNSLANALALMDSPEIAVILVGGSIQQRRRATLGPLAVRFLEDFHVDKAFLAFNGVDVEAGFTVVDFEAAEIKRKMMSCAAEIVALSDSSKIGQRAFAAVAPLSAASLLVTDWHISDDFRAAIDERGVRLHIVSA
jgi:DeoR family fructose operon transcriptional repressor